MNRHQFQQHARHFRSGKISLNQLTDLVFANAKELKPVFEKAKKAKTEKAGLAGEVSVPELKARPADAHKGDFGRVLAIGGSQGMGGAIALTAMAALRSGSGLVTAAVPESVSGIVAGFDPCIMTLPCQESVGRLSSVSNELKAKLEVADAIAVGPGLGHEVDRDFLVAILQVPQTVVVDADAIHLLASANLAIGERKGATILTPHPGEFSSLTSAKYQTRDEMQQAAKQYAQSNGCVVVLKGQGTFVTDGQRDFVNRSGNVGLATAGSGDVLTGVIASLVGQSHAPFDAAVLGVHLHGRAGDFAAERLGDISMVATDVLDSLAQAFKSQIASAAESRIGF